MMWTTFYRQNQEVIDKELLPLISNNLRLAGGAPRYMYQKWAWDLAIKLQDSNCMSLLQRKPIFVRHKDGPEGKSWTEWDYARMEFIFALLGRMIMEKIYKQNMGEPWKRTVFFERSK